MAMYANSIINIKVLTVKVKSDLFIYGFFTICIVYKQLFRKSCYYVFNA